MALDIQRELGSIRHIPGGNWLYLALRRIQDAINQNDQTVDTRITKATRPFQTLLSATQQTTPSGAGTSVGTSIVNTGTPVTAVGSGGIGIGGGGGDGKDRLRLVAAGGRLFIQGSTGGQDVSIPLDPGTHRPLVDVTQSEHLRRGLDSSTPFNLQGSVLPVAQAVNLLTLSWKDTEALGPALNVTWAAFSFTLPDLVTTISVPASSSLTLPGNPTLSQTAGGTLAARTRFVRLAFVKAGGILAVGPEASFAISVNNLLTVTSPAAPTGGAFYDGWVPLVGSATLVETLSAAFGGATTAISPITFGTNWTEPTAGVDMPGDSTTEFISTAAGTLTGLLILGATAAGTAYSFYAAYDMGLSNLVFPDGLRVSGGDANSTQKTWQDGRIAISGSRIQTTSPASGGSGGGSGGGGRLVL